jgi:hypothetical protein
VDPGKLTGIKQLLAACEEMPGNQSPGRADHFLGWDGVLLPRFLGFRLLNGHNANTAIRIGTDTNRPLLDLLPDEFLDFRQVGVGFEVTPVSIISRASHRSVQSMTGKGASTKTYVSMGSIGVGASFEKQGVVFWKHGRQNEIRHPFGDYAMRRFRFHISTLVILVLLHGVGFAAHCRDRLRFPHGHR